MPRKDTFWELSLWWLQEDFESEAMALSYLDTKFWSEVVEDVKNRVAEIWNHNFKNRTLKHWIDYSLMR